MTIKIDRAVCLTRLRDRDTAPQIVILRFSVRDDHIQTVDRTALEDSDQHFLLARAIRGLRVCKLMEKLRSRGHKAEARQADTARFEEIPSVHKLLRGRCRHAVYMTRGKAKRSSKFSRRRTLVSRRSS